MTQPNLTAKPITVAELAIGDTQLGLFRRKDKWNGLERWDRIGQAGYIICAPCDGRTFETIFGQMFTGIFGDQTEADPIPYTALTASPDIAAMITGAGNASKE